MIDLLCWFRCLVYWGIPSDVRLFERHKVPDHFLLILLFVRSIYDGRKTMILYYKKRSATLWFASNLFNQTSCITPHLLCS